MSMDRESWGSSVIARNRSSEGAWRIEDRFPQEHGPHSGGHLSAYDPQQRSIRDCKNHFIGWNLGRSSWLTATRRQKGFKCMLCSY